jgi:hypothetical protein
MRKIVGIASTYLADDVIELCSSVRDFGSLADREDDIPAGLRGLREEFW